MALDSNTIQQLYKTYLGRDLTPQQLAEVQSPTGKYASYNTPEKLTQLLSSTANATKNKATKSINDNISKLKSGVSLFGGKLPDFTTYTNQNPELQAAQGELNTASSGYDTLSQQSVAAPSKTADLLKAGSSYFGDSYTDIAKRYSDPNSAWYISDPQLREGVVNKATESKNSAMESVISKIKDIYGVLTVAAQNQMAAKSDKVNLIMKNVEKSYDALMSYYGQEQADQLAQKRDEQQHKYRLQEIYASKSSSGGDLATIAGKKIAAAANAGYTRKLKSDGGYDFLDKQGRAIPIEQWASETGMSVLDSMEGSRAKQDVIQNLPDKAKNTLSGIQAAKFAVEELKKQSEKVNVSGTGKQLGRGVIGSIGQRLGTSSTARLYDSWRNANASVLARGMFAEKGTLTDQDISRAKAAMPSLYDTKDQAAAKIALLEEAIRNQENQAVNIWTGTGGAGFSSGSTNFGMSENTITTPDGITWIQNPDGTLEQQ